ncbi:hypothetical protein [Muricoccus aerilatus]|uniref:hypothetical protein n=1 Tax=Muricoccus aerilatus TaxID=452982 RepID=UPI0005C187E9|nr:hypothetical protein [Roseomonas aerilata]
MAETKAAERRILTEAEYEAVARTRHPALAAMPRVELLALALARRLREHRDKARDITHHRRRESRGKAEPRGAGPAPGETGTARKKGVFSAALRRLNSQIARLNDAERAPSQGAIARKALAMKRTSQRLHHPAPGRTSGEGMRALPNEDVRTEVDPRQVGSVSQTVKINQVRRDT